MYTQLISILFVIVPPTDCCHITPHSITFVILSDQCCEEVSIDEYLQFINSYFFCYTKHDKLSAPLTSIKKNLLCAYQFSDGGTSAAHVISMEGHFV
jgi:hypothetical protein